jgi:hypothetical protein
MMLCVFAIRSRYARGPAPAGTVGRTQAFASAGRRSPDAISATDSSVKVVRAGRLFVSATLLLSWLSYLLVGA